MPDERKESEEQRLSEANRITEEVMSVISKLARESERSAVIIGAARLDAALEKLLRAVLRHNPGGADDLFDPDRPLGSVSAKIALAYRMRLIDDKFEHGLQMFRRIRNDFAHSIEDESLSSQRHRNRILEIVRDAEKSAEWQRSCKILSKQGLQEPLLSLAAALVLMVVTLELAAARGRSSPMASIGAWRTDEVT